MKFIEDVHKYKDEENQEYIPVTYFLKMFQEPVDWKKVAEKKAKKDGVSTQELLAKWDKEKNDAARKGTAFHKMMEEQMIEKGTVTNGTTGAIYPVKSYMQYEGVKSDESMLLDDNTTYLEKMIWSKKHRVCGTADLVNVIDGKIIVVDYKTNKKLDKESWQNPRTGVRKKLLKPVQDLDDCNFNLYQLQLNTYMYMLLQANRKLKMGDMVIFHILYGEDGKQVGVAQHKIANLQSHVKAMFNKLKTK